MDEKDLQRLWEDPGNWTRLGFYRCEEDPRVIVPKRVKWTGWTLNTAHPFALAVLVFLMVVACGPVLAALALGVRSETTILLVALLSVAAVCGLSAYMSRA